MTYKVQEKQDITYYYKDTDNKQQIKHWQFGCSCNEIVVIAPVYRGYANTNVPLNVYVARLPSLGHVIFP